jgi:hypothetical protein
MHIEFVEDEQDEVCECCQEMLSSVEDFINEYLEVIEEDTFTPEYFSDMLFDLYQKAKLEGKREAFEEIGNISMNLAFPDEECDCCNDESLD